MAGFYRCNFHYNERGLRVESNIPQDNLFFLSHFKSDGATIQISERTELSNAAVKEMSSSLTFETFGTPCDTFCLPAVPRLIAVFSDLVCSDFEAKGIESSVLKVDMPWSLNSMREVLQGLHCRSEKNSARVLRLDILASCIDFNPSIGATGVPANRLPLIATLANVDRGHQGSH
ncbi:hypothetical protein FGB62_454g04 [Gracilaria domingensis]|nr:hypothetical protein FGB62_454g04 [Gracilaria domingensis]